MEALAAPDFFVSIITPQIKELKMKTIYKGCDISINLLPCEGNRIGYKYYIATHDGEQTLDHSFEGTTNYINDKETINHLVSKAKAWIDEYLGE